MLLERKSNQACMNKVYFILSNKGGGGWFEFFFFLKKGGREGKKVKNGNPLSIVILYHDYQSRVTVTIDKQEGREPDLQILRWICKADS